MRREALADHGTRGSSSSATGTIRAARSPAAGSSRTGSSTPTAEPDMAAAYTAPGRAVPAAKAIAVISPAKKNGTAQPR